VRSVDRFVGRNEYENRSLFTIVSHFFPNKPESQSRPRLKQHEVASRIIVKAMDISILNLHGGINLYHLKSQLFYDNLSHAF